MPGADKLKSIVDRIEKLDAEQKAIGADKRDIFTEAKSAGFNTKALRRLIAERKRKDEDEIAAEVDAYRVALGMPGATYRSVAAKLGVSKSKLQRAVPKNERGTSEDAATKYEAGPDADARSTSNNAPQAERIEKPPATPAPNGGVGAGTDFSAGIAGRPATPKPPESARPLEPTPGRLEIGLNEVQPVERESRATEAVMPLTSETGAVVSHSDGERVASSESDDLTLPKFLDRRRPSIEAQRGE